jgi:hypothetical protein
MMHMTTEDTAEITYRNECQLREWFGTSAPFWVSWPPFVADHETLDYTFDAWGFNAALRSEHEKWSRTPTSQSPSGPFRNGIGWL